MVPSGIGLYLVVWREIIFPVLTGKFSFPPGFPEKFLEIAFWRAEFCWIGGTLCANFSRITELWTLVNF